MSTALTDTQINELNSIFTYPVITNPAEMENYAQDWTRFIKPQAGAVVFPKNTKEVQNLVLWANSNKVELVPSGGRTGLSAGSLASNFEVVVSFSKMNKILEWIPESQEVICEPGVVTDELNLEAKTKDMYFPIHFGATGSSHLGGNIATNAGGLNVIKYGMTRQWVTGLEVVTGKGDVLDLNHGLIKNNSGYDLRHLFIGSEGTLGFITKVRLQLTKVPDPRHCILMGLNNLNKLFKLLTLSKKYLNLQAFEMMTENGVRSVQDNLSVGYPMKSYYPYYVLIDFESNLGVNDPNLEEYLEKVFEEELVMDALMNQNSEQYELFWKFRDSITESITHLTPYKNDISVPIIKIPELLKTVTSYVKNSYPDLQVVWFGHIADGNLHINILKPENLNAEEFENKIKKVSHYIFNELKKLKGSVSAEHGIGLLKKEALKLTKNPVELEIYKNIKLVFDPNNIINPGKIID